MSAFSKMSFRNIPRNPKFAHITLVLGISISRLSTSQMLTCCIWCETIDYSPKQKRHRSILEFDLVGGLQQLQCNGFWKSGKAISHFREVNLGAKLARTIELIDLVFDGSRKLCSFFVFVIFPVLSWTSWSPPKLESIGLTLLDTYVTYVMLHAWNFSESWAHSSSPQLSQLESLSFHSSVWACRSTSLSI